MDNSQKNIAPRDSIPGKYPLVPHLLGLAPLALAIAALWIGFGSESRITAFFDQHRLARPGLTLAMQAVSDWGNAVFYAVYIALLVRALIKKRTALLAFALGCLLAHILIVVIAGPLLKIAIGRPRPNVGGPFMPFAGDEPHRSFPSGHTYTSLGLTVPLGQRYGRPLLWGLVPALVGFSRIYLSMHHPSDLVGAMLMSFALCWLAWFFARRASERSP